MARACWSRVGTPGAAPIDATALLEDAANALRLAYERHESERAQQEASALRRSQELQRGFLSRLSHELRTPLTAISGYASSLLAADVTWDGESEERFLSRIAAESARLGRLVEDLLDFSAIESATLRLHPDWCDLALVLDAAAACLPPRHAARVAIDCAPGLTGRLGGPRPARAGLRQPARERVPPQPARARWSGSRRARSTAPMFSSR